MLRTIAAFDRIGEENAFAVLARANALAAQGRDIINLGIGQPDFRTPDFIVEAAIKALRDGHHGYTPAVGIPPLREAVAADLGKRFKVDGYRFAQRRDADRRGIAVMAVAQRLDRGFNDEIGCAEIGLADAEIDDIAPLGGERVGARQHRKGILLPNAIEGGNGFQHVHFSLGERQL